MKRDENDLQQAARQLAELYPQDPVGLLNSFHWLYQHPDTANFLCGLESSKTAGEALRELQKEGQREYLALAGWALVKKAKIENEEKRENTIKTEGNKSN